MCANVKNNLQAQITNINVSVEYKTTDCWTAAECEVVMLPQAYSAATYSDHHSANRIAPIVRLLWTTSFYLHTDTQHFL